jgi:hypothetical protein
MAGDNMRPNRGTSEDKGGPGVEGDLGARPHSFVNRVSM